MADKAGGRDLDMVLARLEEGWRELAELLRGPASHPSPVLEAENFRLRDAEGHPRGELRLTAEGGAALILSDPEGKVRAQLGLNEKGGAFLTLRDQYGGIIFQVPDGPRALGVPGEAGEPRAALDPSLVARLEQVGGDLAGLRQLLQGLGKASLESPPEAPREPEIEAEPKLKEFLARVERQGRRWRLAGAAALALALLALAGLGLTLSRVQWRGGTVEAATFILKGPAGTPLAFLKAPDGQARLELLDQEGKVRAALGLEADGAPGLKLCDGKQAPRAELSLASVGDPTLNLRDQAGGLRAALGNVGPQNLGPEATLVRPTASLTLFDEKGRVTWLAPRWWRP
jgi:hypothetical protein